MGYAQTKDVNALIKELKDKAQMLESIQFQRWEAGGYVQLYH